MPPSPLPPELQAFDPMTYRGPQSVAATQTMMRDPYFSGGYNNATLAPPTPSPYETGYAQSQLDPSSLMSLAPTPTRAPSYAGALATSGNMSPITGASATEQALGIGAAAPTVVKGGTTTFSSAAAAQAAGYTPVGSAAGGGVIATPTAAAPGMFDLAGIGGAGNLILPAAGALGTLDLLRGDYGPGRGGLQGAASGAAMGSYFGPWGIGIGALGGGAFGLGESLLQKKHLTEVEDKRWKKLKDAGVRGFESDFTPVKGKSPGYREDLGADFIGNAPDTGRWTNNPFAKTRNLANLRGEDTQGYSVWGERYGNDYGGADLATKVALNDEALRRGLIKEHHGTIDIRDDAGFDQYARDMLAGRTPAAAPTPQISKPLNLGTSNTAGMVGRYAPGATPANTRGDAMQVGPPAKGTRISPGVYADGRGGQMSMIPKAAARR